MTPITHLAAGGSQVPYSRGLAEVPEVRRGGQGTQNHGLVRKKKVKDAAKKAVGSRKKPRKPHILRICP